MDTSFGLTIKALRQAKNVEAKALAGSGISYPQLLKFEAGQTMISADKLFYLLDTLKVSLSEFESSRAELMRLQLYDAENSPYNRQVGQAFWSKNTAKLQHLLSLAEEKLAQQPDDAQLQINVINIKACLPAPAQSGLSRVKA